MKFRRILSWLKFLQIFVDTINIPRIARSIPMTIMLVRHVRLEAANFISVFLQLLEDGVIRISLVQKSSNKAGKVVVVLRT